ncbi:MAG: DUF357 domain-containing protein [Thermoplasmata archaeon]|nr:MAG: DUF357 domain-containing protein [Thermoplasmata archaeon]
MSTTNISKEKIMDYLDKTERGLAKVKILAPDRSHAKKIAEDFLNMAISYFSDAKHFFEREEYVDAFACVNYAHGWLDAGVRFGLFDVGSDDKLFTLAE